MTKRDDLFPGAEKMVDYTRILGALKTRRILGFVGSANLVSKTLTLPAENKKLHGAKTTSEGNKSVLCLAGVVAWMKRRKTRILMYHEQRCVLEPSKLGRNHETHEGQSAIIPAWKTGQASPAGACMV